MILHIVYVLVYALTPVSHEEVKEKQVRKEKKKNGQKSKPLTDIDSFFHKAKEAKEAKEFFGCNHMEFEGNLEQ